jgi:hypothetical protein
LAALLDLFEGDKHGRYDTAPDQKEAHYDRRAGQQFLAVPYTTFKHCFVVFRPLTVERGARRCV